MRPLFLCCLASVTAIQSFKHAVGAVLYPCLKKRIWRPRRGGSQSASSVYGDAAARTGPRAKPAQDL